MCLLSPVRLLGTPEYLPTFTSRLNAMQFETCKLRQKKNYSKYIALESSGFFFLFEYVLISWRVLKTFKTVQNDFPDLLQRTILVRNKALKQNF